MTLEKKIETMNRLQARLECLRRQISGIGEICGERCAECHLNYVQGTLGEQAADLRHAIFALSVCEAEKGE